ncbi:hypothetical protein FHL15_005331 [Xylaria flabelliformis]|uniref:Uncharacterized protein n=1 Tax=Xylaria flabelliformis TaxID=2512241 RepID=A0A553I0E7_9PEZI|nr:hypothetical protein FHL15_005331 [Xylaria flabelliformis]
MENQPEDPKQDANGDTTAANAAAAAAAAAAPPVADPPAPSVPSLVPSPPPSSTGFTGQRPYVPQFSASTQLILSRINSKPGSLSAALSSASSITKSIEKSAFEDAKRRLVMNMNTSLTMPMPTVKQEPSSSMRDSFQLRTSAPGSATTTAKPVLTKPAASKSLPSKEKGKAVRGTKRKRSKGNEDTSSSLSDVSDSEGNVKAHTAATMTKSGRQVQKPSHFNPADAANSQKRKHYGKRTVEQALCKMCHDPYIDDDFVSNETRSWFCGRCLAKREKALARKRILSEHRGVSWASKSMDQKRTYLTNLPHSQLVNLLMYSIELHSELPIFPGQEPGMSTKRGAQGQSTGSTTTSTLPRADTKLSGPTSFISAVSTPDAKAADGGGKSRTKRGSTEARGQAERESSVESIPPAWPKVGQGVLEGLEMNEEDLRDKNDFEAFSVTSYDHKGQKVMENGMAV